MSTYNTIIIENPGILTLDDVESALDYELGSEAEYGENEDGFYVQVDRKHEPRIESALAELSAIAQGPVTWHREWDNRDADDPGESEDVWINGEQRPERSRVSGLVPANLEDLIATVRRYIRRDHRGDIYTDMGAEPMQAVMALVDALDPEGARR